MPIMWPQYALTTTITRNAIIFALSFYWLFQDTLVDLYDQDSRKKQHRASIFIIPHNIII